MHCNRLLGLTPDLEAMAVRLARDGLLSGPWVHRIGTHPAPVDLDGGPGSAREQEVSVGG